MDSAEENNLNKRGCQQLHGSQITDLNAAKRLKVTQLDYIILFLQFISQLTDDQKLIVRKLRFGSLLEISCDCSLDELFDWLAMQFNTTSCRIELRNGFKFKFTESVMQKIMGIPSGGFPIITKPTKETIDFMESFLQSTSPTPLHLLSMISDNNLVEGFSRIFLLLALSCFLAPNSKGVLSKKYYSALVIIDAVPQYNWCLFTLPFLVHEIKKMKANLGNRSNPFQGGCKLLLVIAHFEFLISSEFKIPTNSFPRLPLWTNTMLKSFLALDTLPGVSIQFGRLAMKHISATAFSDAADDSALQLPEQILQYINNKLPSFHSLQEKSLVEARSQNFWQTIVSNSIPTLEFYVDDIVSSFTFNGAFTSNHQYEAPKENTHESLHLASTEQKFVIPNYPSQKNVDFKSYLSSIDFLDFPGPYIDPPRFHSELGLAAIDSFIKNFKDSLIIDNSAALDTRSPAGTASIKGIKCLEVINIDQLNYVDSYSLISSSEEILALIKNEPSGKDFHATKLEKIKKEKFSSNYWKFVSTTPTCKGNSMYCSPHETELYPTERENYQSSVNPYQHPVPKQYRPFNTHTYPSVEDYKLKTAPNSYIENEPQDDVPSFNAITDGLQDHPQNKVSSFQTRLHSVHGSSSFAARAGTHSIPKFFNQSSSFLYSNSPLRPFNISCVQLVNRFGTPLNDPGLYKLMEDFEAECKMNEIQAGKRKLTENFSSARVIQQNSNMQFQQVVFATPVQTEFYKRMSASLSSLDSSQRIFQVNEVWVDQKTLTVSLKPGCWMSPHSFDCYSKMLNTDQLIRGRQGLIPNTNVIKHIVQREDMEILMRPMLDHSDPICRDILSEARVGFSLHIANFVHLSCFNDKQWILITANLESRRFFDIMNPDGSGLRLQICCSS